MANYGLHIADANGNTLLTVTDRITRLMYSGMAAAGESGSVNIPAILNSDTVQFAVSTTDYYGSLPPYVTRSGTTISWAPNNTGGSSAPPGSVIILVFAYT